MAMLNSLKPIRKEVVFAIFVGILFGLVVTYGIYRANQALSSRQKGKETANVLPTPTAVPEAAIELKIATPEDNVVVTDAQIVLQGKTAPNAIVTILAEDSELIVSADDDGVFSQKINLIKGANIIEVQATDLNQVSDTKVLRLVYSTEIEE